MDLYCFGDSITYGECDHERGGWADRLKTACMGSDVNVFNLGIGGETTRMMRARLKNELAARFDPEARSIVILAYGANDAADEGGSRMVPEEEYVENLAWAINELRGLGCEVWLLNVTPVARDGVRSRAGRVRANAVIERYNDALGKLSAKLIDVNAEFRKHDLASLFVDDAVHPNAEGHALIFEIVKQNISF